MCVMSMIGDHYGDKWKERYPWTIPTTDTTTTYFPGVTREEFDALKKEVQDVKELLLKAKKYDEDNNEPNCETESKVEFLKKIAEFVGVDLEEVFK